MTRVATFPADSPASRALESNGYFRRSKFRWEGNAGHKEWLHFAVHAEGIDLLVNFSLVDDIRPGARQGTELARLVCLVRDSEWTGDIDHYEQPEVDVRGGELAIRFADNHAFFHDGVFELNVRLRRSPIAMRLLLEPVTLPAQANNLQVDNCPSIQWLVVPRLLATGWLEVAGKRHDFDRALAYHDHNWGHFRWGRNFAWEWGYAAPDAMQNPWTMVFVRLTDRAHLSDLMQAIFLWKHERQHRLFRGDELIVWHEGILRARRVFKLPRMMGLVSPGDVTDVPKRLIARARRGNDRIDLVFETGDPAQVIIPNDDDDGVTIIHEVSGQVHVEGRIDGEAVTIEGPSIFEFLGE
jgi:hypothetical protein